MQFKRLHDPLMKVLFENDEIVAVDKSYGISSHTNDSKVGNEGYIQHGLIELFEIQLGHKLHIVHRLDRTTTGVIVFAKTLEAATKFQGYFRNRETQKTYLFVTASQVSQSSFHSRTPIVVKGSELHAETSFTKLSRSKGFDLWQANPRTGRNHQIRIHADEVGIPLLGDTTYGGARFPFICLHNKRISFPGELSIESSEPDYFRNLKLLEDERTAVTFFELDRRRRIFGQRTSPLRLAPGIDFYGRVLTATQNTLNDLSRIADLEAGDTIVYKDDHWEPTAKTDWSVDESGMKFEIRAGASLSLGLSLEQRILRNWIRENSRARDVLVLFAANGTASVAATLGGAKSVTAVELKKSALDWSRRNFELNSVEPATVKIFARDPISFVNQSAEKQTTYDLIVCDVPSFLRREKKVFKIESDLEALLTDCLKSLTEYGAFVFSTTTSTLKIGDLRSVIESAARNAGCPGIEISNLLPSLDIALPGEPTSVKIFLLKKSNDPTGKPDEQ
jgi:16S rRNA G966 N2-methylase RsmD